ncbi:MAG: hypothetical protein J0I10_21440 [Verrucomicrobia bacterium]|nr:hypothetical protein [Verrucomicrobiota bacterium]
MNSKAAKRLRAGVSYIARADIPDDFYLYQKDRFVLVRLEFGSKGEAEMYDEFLLTLQRMALFAYVKGRGIDTVLHSDRVGKMVYEYQGRSGSSRTG